MSFAESYVLASKVRLKLTKQALDPKSGLRQLVLQANMLDNLMDHIVVETEKKKQRTRVLFLLPAKPHVEPVSLRGRGANVTEYEVESDLDLDLSDYDDYALASDLDSEDDYYYLSDEEEENTRLSLAMLLAVPRTKQLPVMNLSNDHDLLVIYEEDNEEEMPELSRSTSILESESEDEYSYGSRDVVLVRHDKKEHHHLRHHAIYAIEHVY